MDTTESCWRHVILFCSLHLIGVNLKIRSELQGGSVFLHTTVHRTGSEARIGSGSIFRWRWRRRCAVLSTCTGCRLMEKTVLLNEAALWLLNKQAHQLQWPFLHLLLNTMIACPPVYKLKSRTGGHILLFGTVPKMECKTKQDQMYTQYSKRCKPWFGLPWMFQCKSKVTLVNTVQVHIFGISDEHSYYTNTLR